MKSKNYEANLFVKMFPDTDNCFSGVNNRENDSSIIDSCSGCRAARSSTAHPIILQSSTKLKISH